MSIAVVALIKFVYVMQVRREKPSKTSMNESEFYTIRQASELLGVPRRTLSYWVKHGLVIAEKNHFGYWLIPATEININSVCNSIRISAPKDYENLGEHITKSEDNRNDDWHCSR